MIVDEDSDPIRRNEWHQMDMNALARQRDLLSNKISLIWTLNPTTSDVYMRFLKEMTTALEELDFIIQNKHTTGLQK